MEFSLCVGVSCLVILCSCPATSNKGGGGNEVENLIAMIPGKNHVLLQAILFFMFIFS